MMSLMGSDHSRKWLCDNMDKSPLGTRAKSNGRPPFVLLCTRKSRDGKSCDGAISEEMLSLTLSQIPISTSQQHLQTSDSIIIQVSQGCHSKQWILKAHLEMAHCWGNLYMHICQNIDEFIKSNSAIYNKVTHLIIHHSNHLPDRETQVSQCCPPPSCLIFPKAWEND